MWSTVTTATQLVVCVVIFGSLFSQTGAASVSRHKRKAVTDVACVGEGKYYREPVKSDREKGDHLECSRYYLCIGGEVFEFKCTAGLLFDVQRQICDFKFNVDNCHVASESTTPRPLLATDEPVCPALELACGDKVCKPREVFCDDIVDCEDGSDEGYCDVDSDPNGARPCNTKNCTLPDCFCSVDGTRIPGDLNPTDVPQMITLTFDDAVNFQNWDLYSEMFNANRSNSNGCPVRATFYISHEYTNYQYVQKLWNDGHEIAVLSITHRQPERWWTENATLEDWFDEFVGQANILNRFGGVRMEDLRGMRVPFLRVGWNRQYTMMKEFGFVYDSTMVAPPSTPPLWPYTLDYRMPHSCQGASQRCPSRSFPGIWQMVMNQLVATDGFTCAMVDSCPNYETEEEVYHLFKSNFDRHFNSNRAPLGLYFHTVWFLNDVNRRGFLKFVDEMAANPDVYFVTNYQAIEWMRQPTTIKNIKNFGAWGCSGAIEPTDRACSHAKSCKLGGKQLAGERYLHTCFECPHSYPWLQNEFGQN